MGQMQRFIALGPPEQFSAVPAVYLSVSVHTASHTSSLTIIGCGLWKWSLFRRLDIAQKVRPRAAGRLRLDR
jgi:hypothetical protein